MTAFMAVRDILTQKLHRNYFVGLAALLLLFGVVGIIKPRHHVEANNFTYVTVHYDGTTQTVATHAKTIGEVLDRAHIPVSKNDDIEPSRDTALMSNDYNVNIYRARPATVVDGQNSYHIFTAAQSPKEIVAAAGITVYPEDEIAMSRVNDFVSEGTIGLKLTVNRAVPLTLNMYGTPTPVRTQAKTVSALLLEKHVKLQQGDELQPAAETPITSNMTVSLLRNGTQVVTVQEDVPFPTKTIQDADQPIGYKKVQTPGQNGKKLVTYQIELVNGQEQNRTAINSVQQSAPVEQVEVVGAKQQQSDLGGDFARLRQCEAGGVYSRNSGNGYYGAYQYDVGTWANYGGYARPDLAPADVQDAKAQQTQAARGWSPWPACARKLGLL
jgi:uncharacterized protein YabE (DUF348 family)